MPSVHEISKQIESFLSGDVSLDQLEDWSAEYSWNIHQRAGRDIQDLAYQVQAILDAHFDDSNEGAVRAALAEAVRPFALGPVYAPAREFVFGEPQDDTFQSGSSTRPVSLVLAAAR